MTTPTAATSTRAHFTKHATVRAQQRGIRGAEVNLVFRFADLEVPVGSKCYRWSISSRELADLKAQGFMTPAEAEKCQRLAIITDGQSIITTYRH
jgi:hypothetical protein